MSVNITHGVTADANSPFTLATADIGTAHPLTIPADATGISIAATNAGNGEVFELKSNGTKGDGYVMVCRQHNEVIFPRSGEEGLWYLNAIGSTSTAYVNYTYHNSGV